MRVHGQSDFTMVADPAVSSDGSHMIYNVFASFRQDKMLHNYTLLDGAAYYVTSILDNDSARQCLGPEMDHLPPINTIATALNEAAGITSAPTEMINAGCSDDKLFKVSVNGIEFVLCASGSSGLKMYGSDMDIAVEYVNSRMNISVPALNGATLPQCTEVVSKFEVTSTGIALLTGRSIAFGDVRRLKAEFDFSWGDSSSCSCKSTPRPCIFIHGMGVRTELPDNQDSLKYWGNMTGHAPCCTSIKYAALDTVNNTWTDRTQQQHVCDRALAVSETSTESTIADTIVVTHSMGNSMLAGAIATGKGSLDSTSTWVGLAAPMKGSMASDFIQESCAGNTSFVLEAIIEYSGRCPPTTALKSMPYEGGSHSTAELDAAYKEAQEAYRTNVFALMCSESFSGLLSPKQVQVWALGIVARHHSLRNDGMVEFDSCAVGIAESKFGNSWRDRFYRTHVNHYDMQFRYGDALFNKAKMPVKWFECLL
ncbi:hypothetical protein PF005_g24290 [Phytophthora fragariae]|uniref:Uncharacterized protein n=1 Tax=Phytophthora fragariae TaxID=53985 RepID=A0A6A3W7V5_9STRA|nr:hypothetical protein PF005_g24290 [Phytophthora fragariae]